jgi:halocyanin-like protein
MTNVESVTRRRALHLGTLAGLASLAGCAGSGGGNDTPAGTPTGSSDGSGGGGGSDSDGDGSDTSYDGWLSDVSNYDGSPADRTGQDTVDVAVGSGNGLLYDPPAVRISPGTTVVWEWTGNGGQHNVKEESGAFESKLFSTEGSTFEWTFEERGVFPYLCVPHQAVGMKGVVDVVDG